MTLSDLLAKHPKAVEAINKARDSDTWCSFHVSDSTTCHVIRKFAEVHEIGSPLDSIETLLGLIEAKLAAEAPLTDAEIEGMKWIPSDVGTDQHLNARRHNNVVDKLHAEIRRLRAKEAVRG